jgi:cyclophilin family peptidyl-prolyl cis-trans isomerase
MIYGIERYRRVFGGDFYGSGKGGYSALGTQCFPNENVDSLQHIGPGIVAFRNFGPGTNNSQFYITLNRLPYFDGVNQVIGNVVSGFDVLDQFQKSAKPTTNFFQDGHEFRIANCGVLSPQEVDQLKKSRDQPELITSSPVGAR